MKKIMTVLKIVFLVLLIVLLWEWLFGFVLGKQGTPMEIINALQLYSFFGLLAFFVFLLLMMGRRR